LGCSPKELETIYLSGLLQISAKLASTTWCSANPANLPKPNTNTSNCHAGNWLPHSERFAATGQVLPAVRHHHEAWNGTGYPFGLAGEEIPLYARHRRGGRFVRCHVERSSVRKGMDDESWIQSYDPAPAYSGISSPAKPNG